MSQNPNTETKLRAKFVKSLRNCNAKVVPYVASVMGDAGTSDVFVAHKRWAGWIEFKGPETKVKKIQKVFQQDMRDRWVNAFICRLLGNGRWHFEHDPTRIFAVIRDYDILEVLIAESEFFHEEGLMGEQRIDKHPKTYFDSRNANPHLS